MKLMKAFHAIIILFLLVACAAPNADAQTVYITKTGSKYHRGSCQYLRKSKFEISMKEAIARGYDACSVCEPGSTSTPQKPKSSTSGKQCTATTKAGTRCKRMTTSASGRCYQHE